VTHLRRRSPSDKPPLPRPVKILLPFAVTLSVALVVAAVWFASRPVTAGTGQDAGASAGFFTPKQTTPVSFTLPVLDESGGSRTVDLSSLLGKPIVLNMWSSTCTICRTESPLFEQMSRELGDRVRLVGIDTADERPAALAFVQRYHLTYLQLFDPGEHVGSGYGIPGLPVTVFISARGKVVGENIGALTHTSFSHYLRTLLHVG
jgi:thiol-disulfide isomerase/thioredoxin